MKLLVILLAVATIWGQECLTRVNDKGDILGCEPILLAQNINPSPAPTGNLVITSATPRAKVSFSAGVNFGRGIYEWHAVVCNTSPVAQTIDTGWVFQAASQLGIEYVDLQDAEFGNQQQLNRNPSIIGSNMASGAGWVTTALIASKIVTASGPWGAGAVVVGQGASMLTKFLSGLTPNLMARITGEELLYVSGTIDLSPHGQAHDCTNGDGKLFFARKIKGAKNLVGDIF